MLKASSLIGFLLAFSSVAFSKTEIMFYELTAMKSLSVLGATYVSDDAKLRRDQNPDTIVFPAGTSFAVISTSDDGVYRLGVERPMFSPAKLPVEILIPVSEMSAPEFAPVVIDPSLPEKTEPQMEFFTTLGLDGEPVLKTRMRVSAVCPRYGPPTPGMTYCFCYVKLKLIELKFTEFYLPGGTAKEAAGILPDYGFPKITRNQHNAKPLDVCVYTGGNQACPGGCGHIEILLVNGKKKGWYYGPYGEVYHRKPMSSRMSGRPLAGCFRKEGV